MKSKIRTPQERAEKCKAEIDAALARWQCQLTGVPTVNATGLRLKLIERLSRGRVNVPVRIDALPLKQ